MTEQQTNSYSFSPETQKRVDEIRSTYKDLKNKFGQEQARLFLDVFLKSDEAKTIREENRQLGSEKAQDQARLDEYIQHEEFVNNNKEKSFFYKIQTRSQRNHFTSS